jgi:hypothetical protein
VTHLHSLHNILCVHRAVRLMIVEVARSFAESIAPFRRELRTDDSLVNSTQALADRLCFHPALIHLLCVKPAAQVYDIALRRRAEELLIVATEV